MTDSNLTFEKADVAAMQESKARSPRASTDSNSVSAEDRGSWLFLVPSGIVLTFIMLFPLSFAFYLSFFNYSIGNESTFVGFDNYAGHLMDARFWGALGRTVLIVLSSVGLEFCISVVIAYGLYRLTAGAKALNVLYLLPHLITPVAAALFLRWVFMPQFGLLNIILDTIGVSAPDWFGSPLWARLVIIAADVWQYTPFLILVLYAGFNTVDQSQMEASSLDGAGVWTQLFRIMLPSIRPLIVFVLSIRIMDSFRYFDAIYVLTAGGPGSATETLTIYTYRLGFRLLEIGRASALGVLTLIIIMLITAAMILVVYRKEKGAF